jgi:hypothetical protein
MRRFGGPDLTVLQPVEQKQRSHPGREGEAYLECVAKLISLGIRHSKNTSTIISDRILDLPAGSFMYSWGDRLAAIERLFAQQLGIDE